jgi:hypothetical protein
VLDVRFSFCNPLPTLIIVLKSHCASKAALDSSLNIFRNASRMYIV